MDALRSGKFVVQTIRRVAMQPWLVQEGVVADLVTRGGDRGEHGAMLGQRRVLADDEPGDRLLRSSRNRSTRGTTRSRKDGKDRPERSPRVFRYDHRLSRSSESVATGRSGLLPRVRFRPVPLT